MRKCRSFLLTLAVMFSAISAFLTVPGAAAVQVPSSTTSSVAQQTSQADSVRVANASKAEQTETMHPPRASGLTCFMLVMLSGMLSGLTVMGVGRHKKLCCLPVALGSEHSHENGKIVL